MLLHQGREQSWEPSVQEGRYSYERIYFQNLVPHLCRYVPFIVPTFKGLAKGKAFLGAGAAAYTLIAAGQNSKALYPRSRVPMPRFLSRKTLQQEFPWIDENWPATGGLILPECHMNSSERVTLALVAAAEEEGCAVCNYAEVDSILRNGRNTSAVVVRTEEGQLLSIRTDSVANCTGPWLNAVNGSMLGEAQGPITSFFRGSHLVLRDLDLKYALGLPTSQKIHGITGRGGRHIFLIPWRGHTLLGTSYAQHTGSLDDVRPLEEDATQLIDAVNAAFGTQLVDVSNIAHAYSGLYPLTAASAKRNLYQGATDYIVTDHGLRGGPRGYFSLFGAKYTTARKLAERACDRISDYLGKPLGPCITRQTTVPVARIPDAAAFQESLMGEYAKRASPETISHLATSYGTDAREILEISRNSPNLSELIDSQRENICAEAIFCARNEMVLHLDDFVFRRTGIGTIGNPGLSAITRCANLLAEELHWSQSTTDLEVETTMARFPSFEIERAAA